MTSEIQFRFGAIRGEYIARPVKAAVYLAGESGSKVLFVKYQAKCERCSAKETLPALGPSEVYNLINHKSNDAVPANKDCSSPLGHKWKLDKLDPPVIYHQVMLRDSMDGNEAEATTNQSYVGYFLVPLPEAKEGLAHGVLLSHPKSDNVEMVIDRFEASAESIEGFELSREEAEKLRTYFKDWSTLEKCLTLADAKVNPRIAGRTTAKLSAALAYTSPTWLVVNGQRKAGALRLMFYGDPRTGKGTTGDYLRQHIALGKHAIGETSSRTGITYTIDTERGIIVWGVMVEADRGLVVIEALHKFPAEDLATMRETLVKLYVEVRRSFTARAWARTRVISDSNTRQPMGLYPFRCQGVADLPCFKDTVDVTRWDVYIPFCEGEILADDMTNAARTGKDDEEFLRNFRKLVLWIWSRRPAQVVFSEQALELAASKFKQLLDEYKAPGIPVIHEDSFFSILRIAAAFAGLAFSTQDFETLKVEASHVEMATEFLARIFEDLEIPLYREHFGTSNALSDSEFEVFANRVKGSDIVRSVIEALIAGPGNSKDLEAKTGHDDAAIRRSMSDLKAGGWVEKRSSGYILTMKTVKAWRRLRDATNATNATPKTEPIPLPEALGGQRGAR